MPARKPTPRKPAAKPAPKAPAPVEWDVTVEATDEPIQIPDDATVVVWETERPTPFDHYPDDLRAIALQAYTQASEGGSLEGDSEAAGKRAARTWARENNRRMPD